MKSKFNFFLFLSAILFLCTCQSYNHLESARNYFNEGARIENSKRFNPAKFEDPNTAILNVNEEIASAQPDLYYANAYSELGKALESKEDLRKDGALASTLTLKALCEWKMGLYDKAIGSSNEALETMKEAPFKVPRDEALMHALPGLIANDRAFDTMRVYLVALKKIEPTGDKEKVEEWWKEAKSHFGEFIFNPSDQKGNIEFAFDKLENARSSVRLSHPVNRYLVLSQLAGLKIWADELSAIQNNMIRNSGMGQFEDLREEAIQWIDEQYEDFCPRRTEAFESFALVLPKGTSEKLYIEWETIILPEIDPCKDDE